MNRYILLQVAFGIILGNLQQSTLPKPVASPFSAILAAAPLCSEALQLVLDATMSPPATLPTDPADMTYSSPAMDHNLQPVLVHVQDNSGNPITDPVTVFATTIDTNNVMGSNAGDMYDGQLCVHREYFSRFGWCRYLTDPTARRTGVGECADELICDVTDSDYPKGKVNATSVNGVAEFPRLVHTTPALSANRRLRFYAEHGTDSATVDSEEFEVHRT